MTEGDSLTPGRADLSALDRSVDFTEVADRVVSPALAHFIAMRRGGFASTLPIGGSRRDIRNLKW